MKKELSDTQETMLGLIANRSLTTHDLKRITKSSYPPARIKNCKDLGLSIHAKREQYINRKKKKTFVTRYTLLTPINEAIKIYKQLAA